MIESREYAEELVGDLFPNRYQLEEELGSNAISQVFRGKEIPSGSEVQIKILSRSTRSPLFEKFLDFQRQAKSLEQISQPRVARLLAMERTTSAVVLVEEYVAGTPLSRFIPHFRFPARAVMAILQHVVEALEPFHEIGFYHRRLTPSNILLAGLTAENVPQESWEIDTRIIHFGHSLIANLTLTGDEPAEEFACMAPERVGMLPQLADGRSDFYSLGVVAYQLLAGRLPFEGKSAANYLHRVMATNPEPLRTLRQDVPEELGSLVLRMIAKTPEDRPQTITRLRDELRRSGVREESFRHSLPDEASFGLALKVPALGPAWGRVVSC